jgi:molybdopterin synthase sulfur carrier subunit
MVTAERGTVNLASERAGYGSVEVTLRLFAAARQAAGTSREQFSATTVSEALDAARARFGEAFSAVLEGSRVWVNGEPAKLSDRLRDGDEVAVLPPVSGG